MAITNHIKGAVEKFKAKTGAELKDHVLNATYLNGLEGTSYVDITSAQTITGAKTFNAPANQNGVEQATTIFKTSNGGQLIVGKEGPNSGTMLRFDQVAGTPRLYFRASATPGAMVWSQPEKGATLYFDLTNSAGVSTRTTLDARNGTIARTSDIGNGTITIKKNGTSVGSFTTNQSGSKEINLTLWVSDVSGLQSSLNGKANKSHTHAISDVTDLQTRLDGKMDTYTITSEPSSMSKDGFAQFGTNVTYKLTQYYDLSKAFGYVRALDKGGQVSNNNSYFTCFGDVGGGTYIGTAVYDRDYNSTTGALYTSHGLLIDAYGSAFLLSGSKDSEHIKKIATTDDTNSLQNSIDGKQATLVSGTNIRTINGTSILGAGDIPIVASLAEKSLADIINATSSKSGYAVIDKLLIQWGVYNGAHGDTTNWEVTYPKTFYWYPAVILQTKDTNTGSQGLPYSNGAVITGYNGGQSFTFQLRRSETCPVYWIAIGGLR